MSYSLPSCTRGRVMKKLILAGVAIAALFSGSAMAADIRTRPVYKAPPPPPVFSWTGFYIGANVGYGWADTSADVVGSDPASAIFLAFADPGGPPLGSLFSSSFRQKGWLGGVQAGYNWQLAGNWLAGVEADIQAADVSGSFFNRIFSSPASFGTNFPFDLSSERELKWFGTVRGRLGFLLTPNILIFGTGGLSYGRTQASATIVNAPPPGFNNIVNIPVGALAFICNATAPAVAVCYAGSDSRTSVGWAAGAGVEVGLWGNVTAKLEYLHVDLGGQTVRLVSPPPSTPGVFIDYGFDRQRVDIVRAGINYRLDWGKAPVAVMAKY
jgi:outer membrane immunogenic protein